MRLFELRNATEITSPSGLPYRPSSVLRQQLHSPAMRLLSRLVLRQYRFEGVLEYERSFGASWVTYFLRIPNGKANLAIYPQIPAETKL